MTQEQIEPFLGKCVSISLQSGESFQGFLRANDSVYEVDAGSSQTSIDLPESIATIELLKM